MPKQRKRKATAGLGSEQTEAPAWVTGKFPWASLPLDLQERIMSILTVRETARLMWATKSRDARAIHRDMMLKRHEALRDILRKHFGDKAALLMPPLDMANPGDVYITPPIPPLLQLRPHRKGYKSFTVAKLHSCLLGGWTQHQMAGRFQGYFTRAGLEGWGRWDARNEPRWRPSMGRYEERWRASYEGEWRAGKRHWGTWITIDLEGEGQRTQEGSRRTGCTGLSFL